MKKSVTDILYEEISYEVDSITCFRQQLFYLTELNSTPEIKPSLSVATVVAE